MADLLHEELRNCQLHLGSRLRELTGDPGRTLQTVLDEVGGEGKARGLTLENLLCGE